MTKNDPNATIEQLQNNQEVLVEDGEKKTNVLGKGLSALLDDAPIQEQTNQELQKIMELKY